MEATVGVLKTLAKARGLSFSFTDALIGGAALDATGEPFPAATLAACRGADSVLLACIGGPKWDKNPRDKRPETGLLAMRKQVGETGKGEEKGHSEVVAAGQHREGVPLSQLVRVWRAPERRERLTARRYAARAV